MFQSTLKEISLFVGLPVHELDSLSAIARQVDYSSGEILFMENQPSDCFLVILDGQVEVVKALGSEDEWQVAVLSAGEYLGEVGLFMQNQVRSASVRSLTPSSLLVFPRSEFQNLLEREPALAFHIMQEMSQRLRNSEDATVRDLRQKNQQLQRAYEELKAAQAGLLAKERMEAELATARRIQQGLLPKQMPVLPGWSITAHWEPAREVSGDFFDFLFFPDGQIGLVIGDVTGKGVPAALVMATTRSVLRAAAQTASELGLVSPGWLLAKVNDLLQPDMPPVMFVTCLIAIFNPYDGHMVLANAGHCLPYHQSTGQALELRAAGMPLGLMPGMVYEECSTDIATDESLLLYSDGVIEAHNSQGEMFGKNRLGAHFVHHACDLNSGRDLIAELLQALAEFSGPGWEQEDDVTFVVLQGASSVEE